MQDSDYACSCSGLPSFFYYFFFSPLDVLLNLMELNIASLSALSLGSGKPRSGHLSVLPAARWQQCCLRLFLAGMQGRHISLGLSLGTPLTPQPRLGRGSLVQKPPSQKGETRVFSVPSTHQNRSCSQAWGYTDGRCEVPKPVCCPHPWSPSPRKSGEQEVPGACDARCVGVGVQGEPALWTARGHQAFWVVFMQVVAL